MMNGILVIDKPKGFTSTQTVNKVKKILEIKKAGHIGTLDPLATGVLPVCLNGGTKIIPFLDDNHKEYEAIMQLGIETDSMDITGKKINEREVGKFSESDILQVLEKFTGCIEQTPPMFSAIRKNGVRLYELARKGIEICRKPRKVNIEKIQLVDIDIPFVKFFVRCSKGTYIRSLCSDIGRELTSGACLYSLRRVRCCNFRISDAYNIDDLTENNFRVISIIDSMKHLQTLDIDKNMESMLRHGKKIFKIHLDQDRLTRFSAGDRLMLKNGNRLISVVESLISSDKLNNYDENEQIFKINRVFN